MSEQDRIAFEKWLKQNYPDYPPPLSEIWQAATAEAYAAKVLEEKDREIAFLEEKLNAMTDSCKLNHRIASEWADKNTELQANINDLREALEVCKYDCHTGEVIGIAQQALSKTPAQSMQSVINKTIEECANVADAWENISCKDKIRALKEVK